MMKFIIWSFFNLRKKAHYATAQEYRSLPPPLNYFCKSVLEGVYMRPEMKSARNEISTHHKGNSVYITFHCGRRGGPR